MTAEQWARTVRHHLGLGRLLPLGGPGDGAWISEEAATAVLRVAARGLVGVRLGTVRIGLAHPGDAHESVVPAPPSALRPGPLRLTAEFEATPAEPLPVTAELLRTALAGAAAESLGLDLGEVDLRVTALLDETAPLDETALLDEAALLDETALLDKAALLDEAAEPSSVRPEVRPEPSLVEQPAAPRPAETAPGDETLAADAALAVPGVSMLTGLLGRPVHIGDRDTGEGALPRRHVRVELAVGAGRRAVDVAREVRAAVGTALPDHPTVAVLVTAVGG
ncbi:nucleopolyhedrovirus P10 family protein [Streptomyces griseorubiginosus]|uniref:nucleopolyhedrovirus P10 family protein n=1 Tax=Streptomyces griseorubiginosus TaxID=67304 RepID=UPI0033EB4F29